MHQFVGFGGGLLHMVLFWGIVATIVVTVVLLVTGRLGGARKRRSNALAILERRYARGEIDAEEFENRRRTLNG